jgi:hypothetical protein
MIKAEESKAVMDTLLSDCTLQANGSYESKEGRTIWLSFDTYKTASSSMVAKMKIRARVMPKTKSKVKKKK